MPGWLAEAQARRLHAAALRVPPGGQVVEIGSFRGRSAAVLASAARHVVCVDPHLGSDRGPQEIAGDPARGEADLAAFRATLAATGLADRVQHVRLRSDVALGAVPGPADLLFVDGAHRYGPALHDLRRWGARVPPGGRMLVHDAFSSAGVTAALLRTVVLDGSWRYLGRERSLAEWERLAHPAPAAERARGVAAQLASLGWFARNLAIKALLVAGRPGAARRLGHHDGAWPY